MGADVAGGALTRVVGSSRQENGGAGRDFGDHDYGVQLHAVAHGDHDVALAVVLIGGGRGVVFGDVVFLRGRG